MLKSLIVVDDLNQWGPYYPSEMVVSFSEYLNRKPDALEPIKRVINLCHSEKYLGHGYYCSLLAEARNHRVIPTVNAINDLRSRQLYLMQFEDLKSLAIGAPKEGEPHTMRFKCYFGTTRTEALRGLARKIFEKVNFPILEITLHYKDGWNLRQIRPVPIDLLVDHEQNEFAEALETYSTQIWRKTPKQKRYRWEMAILINPEEKLPPSDKDALKRLEKAGRKLGLNVDFVLPRDINRIGEFDALFIRETTEINHHTYRFSRHAELEDLVVVDDPISILRCCNKVYLTDAFRRAKVPTLASLVIQNRDPHVVNRLEENFNYPFVIKVPNGSFSRGVFKIKNRSDLRNQLKILFQESSLLLAQEYLYTEFDWRIGVFNHKPLYANRYFMAKDHWQIYDHAQSGIKSGGFDALPTFEVPKSILDAAIRAAATVGNGLYGIDIKQHGNTAYVIEVNDNPSLEHEVEDAYLGDELYMQIMGEFVRRLENRGR